MKHAVFPIGDYAHGPEDIMAVGNFGVLYRAFWRPRGIHVALKHVPRKSEAGRKVEAEERGAMLQQEFGRSHAGIVPEIYEHGRSEAGDYYIAMELLDGRALSTYLHEHDVSHDEAARIAYWIAGDFLANLHAFRSGAAGDPADLIVYSDLKPDHIFVLGDGTYRALDFGITKRVQQANTSTVNPWASVPYASPRRLREGVVDRDADFWALGVILYEMVTGHHLYPGLSPEAMSRAIERQDPPAPLPPCDPRLAAIIGKLIAPQRHESYQTAEEIAADLRTLIDGGEPLAMSSRISTSVPTARVPISRARPALVPGVSVPTDPLPAGGREAAPLGADAPARPAAPPRARRRRLAKTIAAFVVVAAIMSVISDVAERRSIDDLRRRIPTIEASSLPEVRATLREMGNVPSDIRGPLTDRLKTLAERPILDYRTDLPAVTKPQWEQARDSLALARELQPDDRRIAARAKYVDAHITRISAEAESARIGQARLEQAVDEFREAARLDPSSPDPYLGLARIHAYDFKDPEALADDLRQAEERGHRPGRRERAQTGDVHRFRADRTRVLAASADGDERVRLLREAADDYDVCVERFEGLGNYLDSDANLRTCRQQAERVRLELGVLIFRGLFDRRGAGIGLEDPS